MRALLFISTVVLAGAMAGLLMSPPARAVELVEVSDNVELYEAAYTDQPRVANLPASGSGRADTLAVLAAGAVVGGVAYAVAPKPQRLKA